MITIDFETERIEPRPGYPPEPVGVAVKFDDREEEYWAWGHPSENNCSKGEAAQMLEKVWRSSEELLFHHAKFDLAVAWERLGLSLPHWSRIHDTQFLMYLCDPHTPTLELKPLAADLLDWPAEEQDEIAEYVWARRKELVAEYGGKITRAKKGPNSAGAWIAKCPADLVGRYAEGDVARTYALYRHLYPIVRREGMLDSYDRERRALPIWLENEKIGLPVDQVLLEREIEVYEDHFDKTEEWLRKRLGVPDLNFDADRDLANALSKAEIVDDDKWVLTPTGQYSVSKDNLTPDMFNDPRVAQALGYRNRLKTSLTMFMCPWAEQAANRSGYVSTNWNPVRGEGGGTRTGRPSTSGPNLLNIAKQFKEDDGYQHPEFLNVDRLPQVRRYITADEGCRFLHRDFDAQEMRVFAHFESGTLMRALQEDKNLDPHEIVQEALEEIVEGIGRHKTKTLNFQALYGGGAPAAAKQLRCSLAEARKYKAFHDRALPGRKILNEAIQAVVYSGQPIITWGGRQYYPEKPKKVNGQLRNFVYKLINYLIQGSAADITKEVLCRWYAHPDRQSRFLVTVYDEINVSSPEECWKDEMRLLRDIMEGIELDVALTTSGKAGPCWGSLQSCDHLL